MVHASFFSRRWRLLGIIGIWIINGLLAAGFFWFYQTFIVVGETHAETLRREVVLHEKNRRLLKERKELFAAWQPYKDRIDNFFFSNDRLVQWLEFLEGAARVHHLAFDVSSLDEENTDNPSLRVVLRGTFSDTIQFLHAVETGAYGISVQEGIMRKGSSSEERITQLTFLLYEAS